MARSYFFKRYDRYAKGVSLTYKKKGAFETSIGGICSIISFILLAYWLAVNLLYTLMEPGTFTTSDNVSLTQLADGTYPVYKIDPKSLLITHKLYSLSGLSDDQIS
jgi:hypothetical protein